jgi:L,D-transpeptidase ErfK/SrfK
VISRSTIRAWLGAIAAVLSASAHAEVFVVPPPGQDVVGALTTIVAREDDTLLDIARRHGLGYEDIVRANPKVDTWLPGEGTEVVLPTRFVLPPGPRNGVILNLAEYRLYYFPEPVNGEPALVMTYPISIGRMDWATPLGRTRVVAKARNPSWYVPESILAEHEAAGDPLPRIVPPGPKNPLGTRAMRLGIPGYLIHGTNRPAGVGMRVTHGCIRMFPEDIGFLFDEIAVNTPVRIINEPVKIGWDGDAIVMEVHRTLEMAPLLPEPDIDDSGDSVADADADAGGVEDQAVVEPDESLLPPVKDSMTMLTEQFVAATNVRQGELNWRAAEVLLNRASGIPAPVGRAIKNAATSAASE